MSNDPFAPPAPASDPWAAESRPQQPEQSRPSTRGSTPPGEGEGKVVVTLKGGTGYDAPWIVIHAEDASEALAQLDGTLAELMQKTAQVARYFHGQLELSKPPQGGQNGGYQNQQQSGGQAGRPPNASQPPNGQAEYCAHGPMQFKSGVNGQGKAWSGHFCPQPKDAPDKCDVKWGRNK